MADLSLAKASAWTTASTIVKIAAGLLIVKMLALTFGPAGVGLAGNFRQMITVLGLLAGAGIFNGVTKYVAQYQENPAQLKIVIGTSAAIVMCFSTLFGILLIVGAKPISVALFGKSDYQLLVRLVALVQMGIAWSNLSLAIIKGFRDARGTALALIIASLMGIISYFLCSQLAGYQGALLGMALFPAMLVVPAGVLLVKRDDILIHYLVPRWDRRISANLGKYTLMALITSCTIPVAYVLMRKLLASYYGWDEVGIWQGVSSISDAYLQFITAALSVYLLPTLSRLTNKRDLVREVIRTLRFVLPLVAIAGFALWLLRDLAITFLFSNSFYQMRDLFAWQLAGDVLKAGSYVFGYLVIARESLRLYVLTEVFQFALLTSISSWLIPVHGALGAAQAYLVAYNIYFVICCGVFLIYRKYL